MRIGGAIVGFLQQFLLNLIHLTSHPPHRIMEIVLYIIVRFVFELARYKLPLTSMMKIEIM
jgi:hypothetical protein